MSHLLGFVAGQSGEVLSWECESGVSVFINVNTSKWKNIPRAGFTLALRSLFTALAVKRDREVGGHVIYCSVPMFTAPGLAHFSTAQLKSAQMDQWSRGCTTSFIKQLLLC